MKRSKIQIKLVRSFSIGVSVLSPKFNGLCIEVYIGNVHVCISNSGSNSISFMNFWNK